MIKLFVASDHAGLVLKSKILSFITDPIWSAQVETFDLGPQTSERVDYPSFADLVCKKIPAISIVPNESAAPIPLTTYGLLICGSGQGMAMRANKFSHIRAALCWNLETAELARKHNNANVICLGARVSDHELCFEILKCFLETPFEGGRHSLRTAQISGPFPT